jgi:hypothetical protein
MKATGLLEPGVRKEKAEEVIGPEEFRFYVHLLTGEVREIAPATGLRLTTEDVIFTVGHLVVARVPRREVYFATHETVAPPILF